MMNCRYKNKDEPKLIIFETAHRVRKGIRNPLQFSCSAVQFFITPDHS